MSKGKDYFSKSLQKGLKILSLFGREMSVLTQSEVAKMLDMNMTSTYRYINTLVELGYLDKDPRTKEIRPSIQCLLFCTNLLQSTDYLKMTREVIDRIYHEHNISIDFGFAVGSSLMRIYNREAQETFTYSLPEFTSDCLHNTALGKAYLLSLHDDELEEKVAGLNLVCRTEKTMTDRKALIADIRLARERGYVINKEEYLPGLLALGAPVYDPISRKGIGAVSFDFSVMQHEMEEIIEKYSRIIMQVADDLSGFLPPRENRLRAGR